MWQWEGDEWLNPETNERLHPDLDHPYPVPPHWDYTDPNGNQYRIRDGNHWEIKENYDR
jgi:hypothetical protein